MKHKLIVTTIFRKEIEYEAPSLSEALDAANNDVGIIGASTADVSDVEVFVAPAGRKRRDR